ncbi:hypothetical protein EV421DRAFT_2033940 [Armillaria borealis]|uniref:Uncharacterized protein n=1 Tax=Armillaria borealis TaxID=47425 RepID=A0AA39JUM3_9AGAR|nr:hypothetical protein EV421DRAFT_2033940 [Armillaria borealis]
MPPNTAAPAAASSSAWSFNLRTSKIRRADRDLDDSGSDSDPSSDSDVDESHMLDDLDISTRDETVVYKPNPFSIAKINAAARSTNRLPSTNEPSRPIKPTKAGKKTSGSIVDGLRKQSEKVKSKSQRPPPQANATPSTVRSLSKAQQECAPTPISVPKPPIHSEDTHICGDLAPSAPETTSISHAPPSPLRSSHVQAAETRLPRPFDPPALSLPETCPIDAAAVYASFSHLLDIPDAPMRAPDPIRTRPQPPRAFQNQRPLASYFSSPVSRPGISVSPTNNASLSSPMCTAARPIQPIPRSQPQSFFAPQRNILQSTPANMTPRFRTQASPMLRPTMPLAATAVPQPFRPPTPVPVRLVPTPAPPPLYRNEVPRRPDPEGTSFPRFAWNPPVIPSPRADQQPKAPVSNKHARSSHKRQRVSPSPPKTVRPNAYKPSIDPDEEWSTLHRRKKHMAETATAEMRTGAFSLPGISAPGKKSGMSATSSKRVITFLPPPLASTSDNTPVYQQRHETQERPKSQNPYPSPTHSTLSSLIPVCADVTNRELRASNETTFSSPYRPLSPPTSDLLTLVEPPSEGNPCVSIDVDGVASRYHATRMDIRQRKLLSAQARDMLNLESCGIVYRDEGSGDEIAIPLWTGC